jgi:hypothetical protein
VHNPAYILADVDTNGDKRFAKGRICTYREIK